ncbi:hypothetical protein KAFR_0E03190 [Kazachstania africana CBS 2517]|uniref:Uncharacterized protein n=1 Tax=Kazachstania africana (strain ATCC 22294 / BCRC 22015 / CBS 2517 / CECT 1963 / NBRC 1671 / NRRL Y-8276) TaxID=1071382 RepID=H2AVS1_KAZAF|nr:hypothetical protein KAFR_0E03190 [Kazachstania africana CBS 2517]CCF58471.1 hypothetical protein KAFR_0E03190 [Kazachstania africana CBS 2517]
MDANSQSNSTSETFQLHNFSKESTPDGIQSTPGSTYNLKPKNKTKSKSKSKTKHKNASNCSVRSSSNLAIRGKSPKNLLSASSEENGFKTSKNASKHGTPKPDSSIASPWSAIDTLDDVKMMAAENKFTDVLPPKFEVDLQCTREAHVQLLNAMRDRKSRLQRPIDKEGADETVLPKFFETRTSTTEELEPIYVSDYTETKDSFKEITKQEEEYVRLMEDTITGVQNLR